MPTDEPAEPSIAFAPELLELALAPAVADAVRRGAAIEGIVVAEFIGRALGLYLQAQRVWLRGGQLIIEERNGAMRLIGGPRA